MTDHGSINAALESLCPEAQVLPPIDLPATHGDLRLYARTEHIKDSSRRLAVASSLRGAWRVALELAIVEGDIWRKPALTGNPRA